MRTLQSTTITLACTFALTLVAAPALSGHLHGDHHKHRGYGMPYGKPHHIHPRAARHYCHGKALQRGPAYSNWGHPMRHPMGPSRGFVMPGPRYGAAFGHMQPPETNKPRKSTLEKGDDGYTGREPATAQKDIVGTAVAAGNFETLLSAVKAAGLDVTLAGPGPFTVLAPSDAAFSKLSQEQVNELMGDAEALKEVLTYHVIAGEFSAADLLEQGEVTTVNGAKLSVAQLDVAKADIMTSNGIIHVLNAILVPAQ